jgi:hypothetical protein
MQDNHCPVCGTERDDLGLCDPYCLVMIFEDDQARAEAYAAMDAADPAEADRLVEVAMQRVRVILARH